MSDFKCLECKSDSIQKVSVIVNSGTTTGTSFTSGVLLGAGLDILPGFASTKKVNQTNLAQMFAPPSVPKDRSGEFAVPYVVLAIVASVVFAAIIQGIWGRSNSQDVFLSAMFLTAIPAIVGAAIYSIPLGRKDFAEQKERYDQNLAAWNRTWFCHKCGESFII